MRILVTGAAGQVGRAVLEAADARGHTTFGGFASRPPALPEARAARMDKGDPESLAEAIQRFDPDRVVDTGAIHNVDYCESHPEEAQRINRDGTATLARLAREAGARSILVSTDYVFDGTGHPPYTEEDEPRPISLYGRSKREGELAALREDPGAWVVRPSVIYSWIPPSRRTVSVSQKGVNFGSWVIDQLAAGRPVDIVTDQVSSPTLAGDLAGAILALIDLPSPEGGVIHAAGATPVSRFDFTRRLARRLGFPSDLVRPVATATLRQAAPRPPDSSLDSSRLSALTGYRMADLDTALDRLADGYGPSR